MSLMHPRPAIEGSFCLLQKRMLVTVIAGCPPRRPRGRLVILFDVPEASTRSRSRVALKASSASSHDAWEMMLMQEGGNSLLRRASSRLLVRRSSSFSLTSGVPCWQIAPTAAHASEQHVVPTACLPDEYY